MRLKELRLKKGVSQEVVAKQLGCSGNTYSRYEREEREPDIETLKRMSRLFGVSVDYLIGND
jgi:transcriptional regulator with XRE-family HTH domain